MGTAARRGTKIKEQIVMDCVAMAWGSVHRTVYAWDTLYCALIMRQGQLCDRVTQTSLSWHACVHIVTLVA